MKRPIFCLILALMCVPFLCNAQKSSFEDESEFIFSDAKEFSEGLAAVCLDGKWGFINSLGEVVAPFKYEEAKSFKNGYAAVKDNGKWGYINKMGKLIIAANYQFAGDFNEGAASVRINDKVGFIDPTGRIIIPAKYKPMYYSFLIGPDLEEPYHFKNGYAAVCLSTTKGDAGMLIDKTGRELTPIKYGMVYDFVDDLSRVMLSYIKNNSERMEKYGFINNRGELVIEDKYDKASDFIDGYALVASNGKAGFIDKKGYLVVPLKYDYDYASQLFPGGMACVKVNGKCGLINMKGNVLIPFDYKFISLDDKGSTDFIEVESSTGKWGYINLNNQVVIPMKYDNSRSFNDGFAVVAIDDEWGVIDKSGKSVLPFRYAHIGDNAFVDGYCMVGIRKYGNKKIFGYVDKLGKPLCVIMDAEYNYKRGLDLLGKIHHYSQDAYSIALKWLRKTPDRLNAEQFYTIGEKIESVISKTKEESVQLNILKDALFFYKKAADLNHLPSCLKLGNCYYHGLVYQKDYAEAVKWLTKSTQMTKPDQNGNGYLLLGYCYSEGGYGIIKDDKKAFQYYLEGAKYENEGCYYALAVGYLNGIGCPIDPIQACQYADKLYRFNKQKYVTIFSACHNTLAYEYAKKEDFINAISNIDKAISSGADSHTLANCYDTKGEIYLMMGKENEAIDLWNKIMELDEENIEFYRQNSVLYKRLKEKGKI